MKTGIKGRYCCVVCFYLKKKKKPFLSHSSITAAFKYKFCVL